MPCYNVSKYVERAIESIFKQTYKNIELVCVDDGSTDETAEVIEKYLKKYNITLIRQHNQGVVEARRCAIENANGKYIALVDADDYISDDALNKSINYIKNYSVDAVLWEFISTDGVNEKELLTYKKESRISGLVALKETVGNWKITGIGLFNKNIYLDAYRQYDKKKLISFNADEYITRIFFSLAKYVYKAKIKYYYYNNPQSASKKFKIEWLASFKTDDAVKELLITNKIYDDEVKILLLDQFCSNLIKMRKSILDEKNDITKKEKIVVLKSCKLEINTRSFASYIFWFVRSSRSIKNKINFLVTLVYFLGKKV
nr:MULTISPECIES: glycosyltransferase family 2 protein [unclassified Photobacterium]